MPARRWQPVVVASVAIVVVVILSTGIGWVATLHSKIAKYSLSAHLKRVELTMSSGQAVIVGTQSSTLKVRRTDEYAFGHQAREQRSMRNGVVRIYSHCPKIVLGSCSASYQLAVPETVAVNVHTTDGDVRITGFRGAASVQTEAGNVNVEAYCGFDLAAVTGSGDVRIAAACSPAHLQVRTRSGNASALVPTGRYRISASSGAGRPRVSGVTRDARAPFTIQMHSGRGSVAVSGGL